MPGYEKSRIIVLNLAPQCVTMEYENNFQDEDFDVGVWEEYDQTLISTEKDLTPQELEFLSYWQEQWYQHPLNRSLKSWVSPPEGRHALKFDWEDFIGIHSLVLDALDSGVFHLPSYAPPRGAIVHKLKTFYRDNHRDESQLFLENYGVLGYDERTHYQFTYGNMEAAMQITRKLWERRASILNYSNWQAVMQFVVIPSCFNYLSLLQKELNGFNETEFQEMRAMEIEFDKEKDTNLPVQSDFTFYCHNCASFNVYVGNEENASQIAGTYCSDQSCSSCDLSHKCFQCSSEHHKEFEVVVDHVLIEGVTSDFEVMEICDTVPKQEEYEEMEVEDTWANFEEPHDEVTSYIPEAAESQFSFNEENRVIRVQEMLRIADPLNLCCKCYQCVKSFVRHSRMCVSNFDYGPIYAQSDDTPVESVSSTLKDANITFVDERPVISDDAHTSGSKTAPDSHCDISETPWSLTDLLTREIRIGSYAWTEEKDILLDMGIPAIFFQPLQVHGMIYNQMRFFGFWRGGVEVRINLNGTKFHNGRMIMCYIPPLWKEDSEIFALNNYTNYPHQFLDASVSNTAVLQIPYTHLLSHFPVEKTGMEHPDICSLGRIVLRSFNKLRFATGASSQLNITVFAKFINPVLSQPRKPIGLSDFSFGNGIFAEGDEGSTKQGWIMNSVIGGLSAGAARLTGGLVTGGLRVLAGMVFDKPTAPLPGLPIVNKAINAPCHGAGLDDSVRLSLTPISQTETTPALMGSTDPDFNILTLCKIPSRTHVLEWTTDSKYATTVVRIPVTPTYIENISNVKNSHAIYEPSMLSYVSRAFCYWRGSLKYKIQVISTQFHSGRLAIYYDPFWTPTYNRDINDMASYNTVIVDIQEQKEVEITVPFMSARPWMRCDTFTTKFNSQNVAKDEPFKMLQSHTGQLAVLVLNELVAPSNVAPVVDVNVFVYAGDDFELAVPNSLYPLSVSSIETVTGWSWAEYPFKAKEENVSYFPAKERILACYYAGKRLASQGRLKLAEKWIDADIGDGWGKSDDTFCWFAEKEQLKGYDAGTLQEKLIASLANYKSPVLAQSKEEQLTDRNNELSPIDITKGHKINRSVAAETLSENAMNLNTVLKRAYPVMYTRLLQNTVGYTMITIPVTPTFIMPADPPIQKKFANPNFTNHLQWFSALYTYWRGSLRYKFLFSIPSDAFVFHVPISCHSYCIRSGVSEKDVMQYMSFAGTMAQANVQSSLEVEVPFFSPYNQCLTDISQNHMDMRSMNGTLFLMIRNSNMGAEQNVAVNGFVGAGEDFVLNLLRATPRVTEYSKLVSGCKSTIGYQDWTMLYPDSARNRGDDCDKFCMPGTSGFKYIDPRGAMSRCVPVEAPVPPPDKDDIHAQGLEDWVFSNETKDLLHSTLGTMNRTLVNFDETVSQIKRGDTQFRIHDAITNFNQTLSEARDVMTDVQNTTLTVKNKIMPCHNSKVNKYVDLSVNIMMVFLTVQDTRNFFSEPSTSNLLRMAMSFSSFLGYNFSETLKTLLHSVADWVIGSVLPRAQAMDEAIADAIEDVEETVIPAVAVIGTILYAYLFDCLPSFDFIKKAIKDFFVTEEKKEEKPIVAHSKESLVGCLRNAHFATLGMKSIGTVYDKMCSLVKRFLDWLLERENPAILAERKAGIHKDELIRILKETDELDYEPTMLEALQDPLVHNRFYHLMDSINKLMETALKEKFDPRLLTIIKETRTRIVKLVKVIETTNSTANVRYDPFIVFIEGETGTCKTEVMYEVSKVLAEVMNLPEYNQIYAKTTTADGFVARCKNQRIWNWDEAHQCFENDSIEAGELIEMRGNAPRQMNMPGCEEKGMQFNAQGVILTGNNAYANFDKVIRCKKAYLRKRQMVIGAQHKDGVTVKDLQESDSFDPTFSHIHYAIKSNMENVELESKLDLYQMLNRVREKATVWHKKQLAILDYHKKQTFNQVMPRGIMPIAEESIHMRRAESLTNLSEISEVSTNHTGQSIHYTDDELENYDEDEWILADDDNDPAMALFAQSKDCACKQRVRFVRQKKEDINPPLLEHEYMEGAFFLEKCDEMTCCEKTSLFQRFQKKTSTLLNYAFKVFEDMKTSVFKFFSDNPKLAKVLGLLTLFGTSGALLWKLMESKPVAEASHYSVDVKSVARSKVVAEGTHYGTSPNIVGRNVIKAEGNEDPQAVNIAHLIHPYVVPIKWAQGEKTSQLKAFHIGGSVVLTTYHFFNHAKEGDLFTLNHRVNPIIVEFNKSRLVRLNEYDWCIYDCGPRLEPRRKLIKYFIAEEQLSKVKKLSALLLSVDQVHTQQQGTVEAIRTFEYSDRKYGDVFKQSGWKGDFISSVGDCGSVVVGLSNQIQPPGKILGIHVAGRDSRPESYAVLITREKIQQAWDLITSKNEQVEALPMISAMSKERPITDAKLIPMGDYSLYGIMPNKLCPAQPQKTAFIKTPFYEDACKLRKCQKIPAKLFPFLKDGVRISPLKLALEKYGHSTIPFTNRNHLKVKNFLSDWTREALTEHSGKRVFSEVEAVMGIPGIDSLQRMNLKSSPGWPYQVDNKNQSGKWYLFNDNLEVIDSDLRRRIDERLAKAKKGERTESLWRDCLKDELRPIEKVEKGKTRLFTIAPVDFTLVVRQYFMDFCSSFYQSFNKDYFSAVGINAESLDWTEFYNYLAEKGKRTIAGDFGMFDGTAMPEAMKMFIEIVNDWYDDSPENKLIREVLGNEMIHTMQLCENLVYATHQGNKSGNPVTVIKNCFVNLYYMLHVWLIVCPDKTLDDFRRYVRIKVVGDDNVATVEEVASNFNQVSIAAVLAAHGIEYTDDNKEFATQPFRHLDDVTFLKRGFRRDSEFGTLCVLPTMSTETLYSFMFYVRNSTDLHEQLRENMRAGLSFAAFHGRDFYNAYKKDWDMLMRKAQFTPLSITFEEHVDIFKHASGIVRATAQEAVSSFMSVSNHKISRCIAGIVEAPLYYCCAAMGILSSEDSNIIRLDDRFAVAIPSGEGKSFLCTQFPHVFVDHDELLIPKLKISKFLKTGNPWKASEARNYDFPKDDRRILLVHHPDNTTRQMIGSFITHFPTFVRVNVFQRLLLSNPLKLTRENRNALLVTIARKLEPNLFLT